MTASADQLARPRRALHPPLTDFPIAAYVFTAAFDVISAVGGQRHGWAREFWHAGTFVLIAGAIVCVLAVLAGFRDLLVFSGRDLLPVRTISVHVCVMVSVFMIGVADIAWRIEDYQTLSYTPPAIVACSVIAAIGVCVGAAYGGSLVFRHRFSIAPPVTGPGAGTDADTDADAGRAGQPASLLAADIPAQPARHRSRRER